MKNRNIVVFTFIVCVLLSCISVPSRFVVDAAGDIDSIKNEIIKDSIGYLISSKKSDNSFGYSGLINDTAEEVAILNRFSDTDVSDSLAWINSYKKDNNDEIARAVMATGSESDLAELFKSQNSDGGFGLTGKYESDVYDSILVLEAVNSLNKKDRSNATWRLVTYIARQMNKNGSFSYTKNSDESVSLTAMAIYVVSKYMSDNGIKSDLTNDMISKSASYLKSKSKNTFTKETIEQTLYTDLALQEAGLFELQEDTITGLKKVQEKDGSFYGDVHLTSLAVWLLGKMENINRVKVVDLKTNNTSQAYYGEDTDIKVSYVISYDANIDKNYAIACVIRNGSETIYESEKKAITLSKEQNVKDGSFEGISINQDRDNGIKVIVTLYDGDEVVKKSEGSITMDNKLRAGETEITDFTLDISDYVVFTDNPKNITASYKLLYTTNVDNTVDMVVTLTKDGDVLKEETYTEELRPENDTVQRDALTFMPDTTSEGKYTITARCLYKGEQLMQYTADVYIVNIMTEEDDIHTITEPVNAHVPFTVKWIGPRLSDYMIYAGKKKTVTGDVGIICYGDDDFSGKVIAEVMFGNEQISLVEKDVSISVGENNVTVEDMVDFEASELGDYVVTATLYDKENNKILSGNKTVKVVEKKKIGLIANSNISESENRTVDISWNDISNSDDAYNYRLYRRYNDNDWEPRSIWNEKDKVKVLNVYPNKPLLQAWMTETISNTEYPAGMGMFDIDSVYYKDFNNDPEKYMLDGSKWKYDVVFYGTWDSGFDLNEKSYEITQAFANTGRGVLFGHDTLWLAAGHKYFNKFADQLGILLKSGPAGEYSGIYTSVLKIGTLTNFPWTIRGTLKIPRTHTSGQFAGGTLEGTEWMSIDATQVIDEKTQANSNFYLVTNNNLGMIQTGHSNGQATDDERKVIANTLFYLHQISQVTTAKDNSFYDVDAPDSPEVRFAEGDDSELSFDISSKDNGTVYQYYIAAMSSSDKDADDIKSNIMTHTALSGLKGYVYGVSSSPEEDKSIISYDENGEYILNAVDADENGNLKINIDTSKYDENMYLHVYAIDNENNVSGETVISLGEGKLSPNIETDKTDYYNGETVKVHTSTSVLPFNSKGDVSIKLYDESGNFVDELYGENDQNVLIDSPYVTDDELYLDENYKGNYKVKIEWETPDAAHFTDETEFIVGQPQVPKDEDKTLVDVHTTTAEKKDYVISDNPPVDPADNQKTEPTTEQPTTENPTVEDPTAEEPITEQPTTAQSVTEQPTTGQTSTGDTPKQNSDTYKTPNTGDEINIVMIFAIMGILAVIIVVIARRKRVNKNA
ncbi:MAG: LPXTG cell wall anchor domain-containing protein [Eubacterium sp.]|nr:LPXTG cell wall anchor domain-containing protein [Eubacterium sp.]